MRRGPGPVSRSQRGLRLLRPAGSAGLVTTRKQGRVVYNQPAHDFPQLLKDTCRLQLVTFTHTADDEPPA
ncbi:hypothetical protein ABIB25_005446 [Nakamurella sp. UYEF19]|uniref:hypothetical protein n=1 Tax=Nakamurella sp. UYEF19 TaxID=1756392 RepID=UPI0033940879